MCFYTHMFLQESQPISPFNFLRNFGENKTYDCFMHSTDLLWLSQMIQSTETACLLPDLEGGLQGEPWKPVYEIGERITLSCPHGMHLEGAHSILCEPSLKWSPDVKTIQCKRPPQPSGKMQEILSNYAWCSWDIYRAIAEIVLEKPYLHHQQEAQKIWGCVFCGLFKQDAWRHLIEVSLRLFASHSSIAI